MAPREDVVAIAEAGKPFDIAPCGLEALDMLRIDPVTGRSTLLFSETSPRSMTSVGFSSRRAALKC